MRHRASSGIRHSWLVLVIVAAAISASLLTIIAELAARLSLVLAGPARAKPALPVPELGIKTDQRPRVTAKAAKDSMPITTNFGERRWDYLPPLTIGEITLARAVDFLMRNRGGRHGPLTDRRWRMVEEASFPLAVYLRQVDDQSAWRSLQREREVFHLTAVRAFRPCDRDPDREKLVKLVSLAKVWARRGEQLIAELNDPKGPTPNFEPIPSQDGPDGGPRRP